MNEPRIVTLILASGWARLVLRFINWLKALRRGPDPLAGLSRKHRRAILFASSAERRMRAERTATRWKKRHGDRKPSDNGAKYRRSYTAGYYAGGRDALEQMRTRVAERAKQLTWKKPEPQQVAA